MHICASTSTADSASPDLVKKVCCSRFCTTDAIQGNVGSH